MERQHLFGQDIRLSSHTSGQDLGLSAQRDIDLAKGNDNIVQALTMRLLVRKGELSNLGWPDYGSRLHELIGQPNNNRTQVILMAHARTAIEQDPRVLEVLAVQAVPREKQVIQLSMDIQLIHAQHPLNLVLDVNLEAL